MEDLGELLESMYEAQSKSEDFTGFEKMVPAAASAETFHRYNRELARAKAKRARATLDEAQAESDYAHDCWVQAILAAYPDRPSDYFVTREKAPGIFYIKWRPDPEEAKKGSDWVEELTKG